MIKKYIILILFFPCLVAAKPIEFSGSIGVYGEYDTLYNTTQERPSRTIRFDFNPRLKIYGMPLSMDFLLSTDENSLRQELNKYRIFLNPSKLLKKEVSLPSFVFSIAGIEIGKCYSSYSKLSLYGTPLTGAAIDMNPGPLYVAVTGGRSQRSVAGSDTSETAYSRTLYAGRFGLGKKERNHLFITFLHAEDDENSIKPYYIPYANDTIEAKTPKDNYVSGIEGTLSFLDGKLNLKSEISGSQFTDDKRYPEIVNTNIPSILTKYTHPNLSSSYDFAHSSQLSLNLASVEIALHYERIGPGYKTLGNEYLNNDEQNFGVEASQILWNGIINLEETTNFSENNLSGFNSYTTRFNEYRIGTGITAPNLPYINTDYAIYIDAGEETTRQNLFSLSSGYSFEKARINFSPTLYYSFKNDKDCTSNSITLGQEISLWFPLNLELGIDWISTEGDSARTLSGYNFSITYVSFNRWSNATGVRITGEEDKNRRDLWYSSSLDLGSLGNFEFRVENNVYNSSAEDYNELRVVSSVSKNW